MEKTTLIARLDVSSVAQSIGVSLTEAEIDTVLENYEAEQAADPTGTWDLIVENPFRNKEREDAIELKRTIDEAEAIHLNKKSNSHIYRAGREVRQFNDFDEIKAAVQLFIKERGIEANAVLMEDWTEAPKDDKYYIINFKEEVKTTDKQIRITHCDAFGSQFLNLTDGSVHTVIETPERYVGKEVAWAKGVWVMGIDEPVKVLNGEFEWVK